MSVLGLEHALAKSDQETGAQATQVGFQGDMTYVESATRLEQTLERIEDENMPMAFLAR